MLVPAVDIKFLPTLKWTTGLGFALNNNTEKRVFISRLEYEIYF